MPEYEPFMVSPLRSGTAYRRLGAMSGKGVYSAPISNTLPVGQAAATAGSVPYMGHPEVRAMLTDDRAPTCSLVEFLEAWNEDPNLVWQVRTGHLIHLLEAAVARIEALEALLCEMEGWDVDADVTKPPGSADGRAASLPAEPAAVGRHEKPPGRWGWIPGRRKETPT